MVTVQKAPAPAHSCSCIHMLHTLAAMLVGCLLSLLTLLLLAHRNRLLAVLVMRYTCPCWHCTLAYPMAPSAIFTLLIKWSSS